MIQGNGGFRYTKEGALLLFNELIVKIK